MFSSKPKFDGNKCKVQLKMLINRFNLLSAKKGNLAKAEKRNVAMLIRDDKEHNARILVEQIIREDYTLEAYDLLKQYTELLIARLNVIIVEDELKPEIADAVCAIVYSGWLMGNNIDELKVLFALFTAKYGKVFTQEVIDNAAKYISERLLKILSSTQVPDQTVVEAYLVEIAKSYGVEYIPKPASTVQATSATLGIVLPTPGMPMPKAWPADGPPQEPLSDVSGGAPVPAVMPSQAAVGVAGEIPYTAVLTKTAQLGFGLELDGENLVTGIKPGSEASTTGFPGVGYIAPGDRVLAINGKPCSPELPAKSLAADIEAGATASLTMLRLGATGGAYGGAGGGSTSNTPVVVMPSATPASGGIYPTMNNIMAGLPVEPPPQPPPVNESADDMLARRLEALKRGGD